MKNKAIETCMAIASFRRTYFNSDVIFINENIEQDSYLCITECDLCREVNRAETPTKEGGNTELELADMTTTAI